MVELKYLGLIDNTSAFLETLVFFYFLKPCPKRRKSSARTVVRGGEYHEKTGEKEEEVRKRHSKKERWR
ncbi:TPA: hypothetical protein EYP66_11520 [Candidatus Poribacteria bacterium]|nr:hypothetical protein [Candidatus Poribacteria bacterium]